MMDPSLIGWLAAGLTLLTFSMRSMLWLRISALAANVCFITYGALAGLAPVLVLHLLLLPCNLVRLRPLLALTRDRRFFPSPALIRAASKLARRRVLVPSRGCDGRDLLFPPATRPGSRQARPAWPFLRLGMGAAARDRAHQHQGAGR